MRFDHVGVLVADLDQAKAFARDVLGLGDPVAEFEAPEHGLAGTFFGLGDGKLELFTVDGAGDRLPAGHAAAVDHIAVKVADLGAEQERLAAQGVTFTDPASNPVDAPVEVRGAQHLWTVPETSGGYMLQITEDPSLAE